jgi:DNA repair protein RecN (Recombination protein N)
MLRYLSVQNFSVIEDIEVEFSEGLNIFTGETGAGKTVIVNAVKLLVGEKLNKSFFRDESKPIKIQGVFSVEKDLIDHLLLEEFDIDDEVIIKREFDLQGKNRISINGNVATLKQLQMLTENFIDIHGQHEHQLLLDPKNHLSFVDMLVDEMIKNDYLESYVKFKHIDGELRRLTENLQDLEREKDFLTYQINEIESLEIDLKKDADLEDRIYALSNADRIRNALIRAQSYLTSDDVNVDQLLTSVHRELSSISKFSEELKTVYEKVDSLFYDIQDISKTIEEQIENYSFDEDELNILVERKDRINRVCKKYDKNLDDLPSYLEELKLKLSEIDLRDEKIDNLKNERAGAEAEAYRLREILNAERGKVSEGLAERITSILKDLELKNAKFKIYLEDLKRLDEKGGLNLEFYISTNVGFDPGPLSKIASGGEISRVMLALKEAFSEIDIVDTLIFDEIDTGISGITAKKVAEKLKKISKNKQVIVITHLPVVASMGDKHFHLVKKDDGGKTKTTIQILNDEDRKKVIASMIAGEITDSSLKQAEDLLKR